MLPDVLRNCSVTPSPFILRRCNIVSNQLMINTFIAYSFNPISGPTHLLIGKQKKNGDFLLLLLADAGGKFTSSAGERVATMMAQPPSSHSITSSNFFKKGWGGQVLFGYGQLILELQFLYYLLSPRPRVKILFTFPWPHVCVPAVTVRRSNISM